MEKELSTERSLEIIKDAIEKSRRTAEQQMGTHLILWGVLVMVTALVVGHLWEHSSYPAPIWNVLWLPMVAVGFSLEWFIGHKETKKPATFVSKVVGWIWRSFCGTLLALFALVLIALSNHDIYHVPYIPLTAIIMILMVLCAVLTGLVVGNRLIPGMAVGGGICCVNGCLMWPGSYEMLFLALVALVTLLIPGIFIKRNINS